MTLENLSRNETKIRYPSLFQILDEVDINDLTHFPQPTWQRKSAIPVLQNNTKIAPNKYLHNTILIKLLRTLLTRKTKRKIHATP